MLLIAIGALMILLEIPLRGMYLLWLGIGAAAAGAASLLIGMISGDPHWATQTALLCFCTLMALAAGRALKNKSGQETANVSAEHRRKAMNIYLGRQAEVKTPITGGVGKIKLDDKYYTAHGPNLPKGAIVEITGFSKNGFTVIKADTNLD